MRYLLTLSILLMVSLTVKAQTQIPDCTDLGSRRISWAPGSVVRVSYQGTNPNQLSQIQAAVFNWNIGNAAAGVDVAFSNSPGTGPTLIFTFGQNTPNEQGIIEPAQMINATTNGQGVLTSATVRFDLSVQRPNSSGQPAQALNDLTSNDIFTRVAMHEIGHTMGNGETVSGVNPPTSGPCAASGQYPGSTVMNGICGANDWGNNMPTTVTPCDQDRTAALPQYQPTPPPEEGGCEFGQCEAGCSWDCSAGGCVGSGCDSPIIIDLGNNGFNLTSVADGVQFNLKLRGPRPKWTAWTALGSDDAFLAYDRNEDGIISDGGELFGNNTPQVKQGRGNGFLALAAFDSNKDGLVDSSDAQFRSLLLWRDMNHNGISGPGELTKLSSAEVLSIELQYKTARRVDRYGNRFIYRAKVRTTRGERWAYDVWLSN